MTYAGNNFVARGQRLVPYIQQHTKTMARMQHMRTEQVRTLNGWLSMPILSRSLPTSGPGLIINSGRKSVPRLPGNGLDEGRAAAPKVTEEGLNFKSPDLPDKTHV